MLILRKAIGRIVIFSVILHFIYSKTESLENIFLFQLLFFKHFRIVIDDKNA